jgi:hypothetical protein
MDKTEKIFIGLMQGIVPRFYLSVYGGFFAPVMLTLRELSVVFSKTERAIYLEKSTGQRRKSLGISRTPQGPLLEAEMLALVDVQTAALEHAVANFQETAAQIEQALASLSPGEETNEAPAEPGLLTLTRAFQVSHDAQTQVYMASRVLNETLARAENLTYTGGSSAEYALLPPGTCICDGRYRLLHLLYARPRVHLYLARRLRTRSGVAEPAQSLVAIRELVLTGLDAQVRQQVIRAAFEEFAAPQYFGSSHLPGVGDQVYSENERHYLVMQPRRVRGSKPVSAQPLSEVLHADSQRGAWPGLPMALHLGIRLCQAVAHLHRQKLFLGELTPEMVLVDRSGGAPWAPLLLAAWPPAPSFWPEATGTLWAHTFPHADTGRDARAFAAPEIFEGRCDERSDVYTLGAILYFLLTGSLPAPASRRLRILQAGRKTRGVWRAARRERKADSGTQALRQDLTLTPPHQFNAHISPLLEQILLIALALSPQQRFSSVEDLTEALEGVYLKRDLSGTRAPLPQTKVSRLRKLLEWLRLS